MRHLIFLLIGTLALSANAQQNDISGVEVSFYFVDKDVDGTIEASDAGSKIDLNDFTNSKISRTAVVETLDTNNFLRDGHLMWKKYFYEREFPELQFESTKILRSAPGFYTVDANLTIKGITKSVTFLATVKNAQIEMDGSLYTSDFGIKIQDEREENKLDVKINLTVQD